MKKEFETISGHLGIEVDCGSYSVKFYKSIDGSDKGGIEYIDKLNKTITYTPPCFLIDWDKEEDGGRLQFNYRDRWGSEMIFIHYAASDLKGMFDFIAKGYDIKLP